MNEKKIEKLVEEYESKRNIYNTLSLAVKNILEIIIKKYNFKCQTDARAKTLDSLREKLENRVEVHCLEDIQDLAGCRVLFYIESDIDRFERYLNEEFEVIRRDDRYSKDDYNAVHYIVKLKDNRTALPEYSQFAGMVCEIQLTTILYHAWSEMAHDIIYKPPHGLPEFDERAYEALRKRFRSVMEDHIKKASYDFEFIHTQFEKIKEGKKVFDADFLGLIERSDSNNEIHQNLKIIAEYVHEFGDKASGELGIMPFIRKILEKSAKLKVVPIKTPIGEMPGHDYGDVAKVCLEILDAIRYWHPDETFDLLLWLSKDERIKHGAFEVLKHLAHYNLAILKQVGYAAQNTILQKIETWSDPELLDNLDFVLVIAEEFLHSSFEGTSWQDEKTMVFSSGALAVNDELKTIRRKTVEILKKLYKLTDKLSEREYILRTLSEAVRTPHQGSTPEMDQLVAETANEIVSFYIEIASGLEPNGHVLEDIEEQIRWYERRFTNGELKELVRLESLLAKNRDYQIFRTLVGYDGKLARGFDFEKDQKERPLKIKRYVAAVTAKTFLAWEKRILAIVKDYESTDPGQYQRFEDFLQQLGQRKPALAARLLDRNETALEPMLLPIVTGIWKSSAENRVKIKTKVSGWIGNDKYLRQCAFFFVYIREIDEDLFGQVFRKAVSLKDPKLLNILMDSVIRNYESYPKVPSVFVNIVRELTKCENASWVRVTWYKKGVMEKLSSRDFDIILKNLLWLPSINYEAEEILRPIAETYPSKIINFFHDRIGIELRKEHKLGIRKEYDAVPHELHRLGGVLAPHENIVIPAILAWYEEGDEEGNWLYRWDASHLLQILFPAVGATLEKYVAGMLERDGLNAIDNILYILGNYRGQNFLWNICKMIIKKFSPHKRYKKIKSRLFGELSQTGVVSGEHGIDEAYEKKAEALKSWPDDNNPKFKAFLKEYGSYLKKQAVYMRKRADSEIEFRKRSFEK